MDLLALNVTVGLEPLTKRFFIKIQAKSEFLRELDLGRKLTCEEGLLGKELI
jgi:hypothetical protein